MTLTDPQGISYILPPGKKYVTLRRSRQTSHAASVGNQSSLGPASENDFATAWIDHGAAPKDAGYEYAILINRSPAEAIALATTLGSPEPAYQVLRRDDLAHVVKDRATGIEASSIFAPTGDLGTNGVVRSCNRPFLAMAQRQHDGTLRLSLCDPQLHLNGDAAPPQFTPTPTTLVLDSSWRTSKLPPEVVLETDSSGRTRLVYTSTNAAVTALDLEPVGLFILAPSRPQGSVRGWTNSPGLQCL